MDLPSFLWLWKIAAWSMGLSLLTYSLLGITGFGMFQTHAQWDSREKWRTVHLALGLLLVVLVVGLLGIGIVGTLGHYGSLGHSVHGPIGGVVVGITLLTAGVALQIKGGYPWARPLHIALNVLLGVAFLGVLGTGWIVVQKYLP
jgi:Protein of unknown function (DUF4079)